LGRGRDDRSPGDRRRRMTVPLSGMDDATIARALSDDD
jgi:hypothetical protein